MALPVAARVAADALGTTPTSYGHLQQMAARHARLRLDGHVVVNRQTGATIGLDYERGLKNATAPGLPPALLLTVPAIPAMLATARYLGPLAPRPPCPPHVLRYQAFAAAAEVGGRRIDAVLIAQEDRQHRLFFDRLLGREAPPQREAGGANPDATATPVAGGMPAEAPAADNSGAPPIAPPPLATASPTSGNGAAAAAPSPQDGGWFHSLLSSVGLAGTADTTPPAPPAPIPLADIQKPIQFRDAAYEKMGARLRFLNGKYDPQSWGDQIASAFTGGLDDPSMVMTDSERAERQALKDKLNKLIGDHYDPQPTPDEARLDNMASSPLGTAGWLAARALGASQQQQDAALGTVGALENIGAAAVGPRTPVEPVLNVPATGAARATVAAPQTALRTAPPPPDGEGMVRPPSTTSPEASDPETTELQSASGHKRIAGESQYYDRLNDFEQFRKDEGRDGEDPRSHHDAARAYVMRRQDETGAEHIVAYDAKGNEITHAGTSIDPNRVRIPDDIEGTLTDPDGRVTLHHSHDDNSPLSDGDVSALGFPGLEQVVVHTKDGDLSAARLTPTARAALASSDEAGQEKTQSLLGDLWMGTYAACARPIAQALLWGDFTPEEGKRILAEATNRALAEAGLIDYTTTQTLPSHHVVDEIQTLANAEARRSVGRKIPELANHVPDKSPEPMGIDEGMGTISGQAAAAAPGRPERAAGGRNSTRRAGYAERRRDRSRNHGSSSSQTRRPGHVPIEAHGWRSHARKEVASGVARISGHELEMPPTSYGHLQMMTARYARAHLDGRSVVNRETHAPVALSWQRGIDQIAVPGKPVATLLAVPAIPEMLAQARYLGSAPDPQHRPDVSRVHGFTSAVEIGGRRLDVLMVVRENRQGKLVLDRMEPYAAADARAA
jgi:hypothetical protein